MDSTSYPEELPPLPPEVKIEMKLDDIIKYERVRGGISHVWQRPYRRQPYRSRYRRFRSQNWRLKGNGPNRYWKRSGNRGKILKFLQMKRASKPNWSVFHRLGWNASQEAAKLKLYNARFYQRPRYPYFFKNYQNVSSKPDPNRIQKLLASARQYRTCNGLDGLIDQERNGTGGQVLPLNQVNLSKLTEAVGPIQSVKEGDDGSITIKTVAPNNYLNDNSSVNSYNGYQHYNYQQPTMWLNPWQTSEPTQPQRQPEATQDYTSPLLRNMVKTNPSLKRDMLHADTPPPLTGGSNRFCVVSGSGFDTMLPYIHKTLVSMNQRFGVINPVRKDDIDSFTDQ